MSLFRHQKSTCFSGKTGRWTNVANIAGNRRVRFVQRFWFYMVSRAQFNPNRESKVTFRICIFTCSKTNAKADCEQGTNVLKLLRKISTISNRKGESDCKLGIMARVSFLRAACTT